MANRFLKPIYQKLYHQSFSGAEFDERMKMQKGIYLLQNMGVPVGDYGFRWYIHGLYSQELQDDMLFEKDRTDDVIISDEYLPVIEKLSEVILSGEKGGYSVENWVECLASIHYLKSNILNFNVSKDEVIGELEKRKPHLSDKVANSNAYSIVENWVA